MIKKLLLLCYCFFTAVIFCQDRSDQLYIADFKMKDGSSVKGYFLGDIIRGSALGALILKSKISHFRYTDLDNDKEKRLDADDVQKILFYHGEDLVKVQERLETKNLNRDSEFSGKVKEDFAYLLYDGKLKIYGNNVFRCEDGGCIYKNSELYIKNPDEQYAYMATATKPYVSFTAGAPLTPMVEAFKSAGGKCIAFNEYLSNFDKTVMKEQNMDKKWMKEYQQIRNDTTKEIMAKRKRTSINVIQEAVDEKVMERQMEILKGIAIEYEKNCPR